jgi:DNA-binding response OmpR family regulator
MVLAGRFELGARVAERFRKLGWDVRTVTSAHDVHAAAAETDPHAVLLREDAGAESGYLACVKLRHTQPELKVVVVGSDWTPERERFAEFVGATFTTEADLDDLVNAVAS